MHERKQMAKTVEVKRGQEGYGSVVRYGVGKYYNLTVKEALEIETVAPDPFVVDEEAPPPKPEPKPMGAVPPIAEEVEEE